MTGTRTGQRDKRLVFQRMTASGSNLGAEKEAWANLVVAYGSVRFGTSEERRKVAAQEASQTATFRVLATAKTRSVTTKDRIVWGGGNWGITGHIVAGRQAREIEFTAIRRN